MDKLIPPLILKLMHIAPEYHRFRVKNCLALSTRSRMTSDGVGVPELNKVGSVCEVTLGH